MFLFPSFYEWTITFMSPNPSFKSAYPAMWIFLKEKLTLSKTKHMNPTDTWNWVLQPKTNDFTRQLKISVHIWVSLPHPGQLVGLTQHIGSVQTYPYIRKSLTVPSTQLCIRIMGGGDELAPYLTSYLYFENITCLKSFICFHNSQHQLYELYKRANTLKTCLNNYACKFSLSPPWLSPGLSCLSLLSSQGP